MHFVSGVALFMCSIPLVVVSSGRQAQGHSHRPTQKPLLHKLHSSFNPRELYLFIICSKTVLLWQGFVSRGNLSPPPPFSTAFSYKVVGVAIVFRTVMFLHCSSEDKETDKLWIKRSSWWTVSPEIKTCCNQYFLRVALKQILNVIENDCFCCWQQCG